MLHVIITTVAFVVPLFNSTMLYAELPAQSSNGTVYLSLIGAKGEHVLAHANVTCERKTDLAEPIMDWGATQVVIMRPTPAGGLFRGAGASLEPEGNVGQMVMRAFEHAMRLRNRDLPNGRVGTVFQVIGGFSVKDSKDLEAALAVTFLAVHNGRGIKPVTILGGLDSQGRLTAVADLNTHLTHMIRLGHREAIIPMGQRKEISEPLQQQIDKLQVAVIEAATLEAVYTLVATDPLQN